MISGQMELSFVLHINAEQLALYYNGYINMPDVTYYKT